MTIKSKTVTITFEEQELRDLADALEEVVRHRRSLFENTPAKEKTEALYEELTKARSLRNEFGALLGIRYCGSDA